jgi:hypothetical protein
MSLLTGGDRPRAEALGAKKGRGNPFHWAGFEVMDGS